MPGFGVNANNGDDTVPQLGAAGMYTPEEVWAIMVYERNLSTEEAVKAERSGNTDPAAKATPVDAELPADRGAGSTTSTALATTTTTTTKAGQ
jgi:hypothetical protein